MSSIRKGKFHRVGDDICEFRSVFFIQLAKIEVLQNIQDLCDMNAARAWRRKPDDLVATIGAPNGFALRGSITSEVSAPEDAAVLRHPGRDPAAECQRRRQPLSRGRAAFRRAAGPGRCGDVPIQAVGAEPCVALCQCLADFVVISDIVQFFLNDPYMEI